MEFKCLNDPKKEKFSDLDEGDTFLAPVRSETKGDKIYVKVGESGAVMVLSEIDEQKIGNTYEFGSMEVIELVKLKRVEYKKVY